MAIVRAELKAGTAVSINARQFHWSGDEPIPAGGTDLGPDPYEMLLGSLASCIAVTVRFYADHKGIPLAGVDVELEFDRAYREDQTDSEHPSRSRIERIQSRVTFHGMFDEAQRTRLAEVAARCPVHKTLANGVVFEDSATFEPSE